MRYINNRAQFAIKEIMHEFDISRATAIRDINEIQQMGFPLVAERGRAGGYFVMSNQFLPSVRFTSDELKAVFISFMASKNSQLPYLQNRRSISEKLIGIATQAQQDELIDLNQLLLFENTNPANPNLLELDDAAPPELNQLIRLASKNQHLQVSYDMGMGFVARMDVYILHLLNSNGQWLVELYDLEQHQFMFLPVVQLRDSKSSERDLEMTEAEILEEKLDQGRQANLIVLLDGIAIQRFKRLHPPGLILSFTGMFQSSGRFNAQIDVSNDEDLDYYRDWLLFLGPGVQYVKIPEALANKIKKRAESLMKP
ncbi:HTH domain-containing protein [Lactococcus sp. dk322]|nr:HTH domain-containing protein [Lactococcus sp. dk101]TXK37984.1 HTH domain-containing protein [Lactococcus sp. dk310]TXK49638.1 HTH domain-containing protein [Lactococcus sp. dk322]